jgi:hypothetical protein
VTFATPHEGAPLAGEVSDLREKTHTGAIALAAARLWALKGGPIPDPYSPAVAQLRPESSFLRTLAREDVMFGTKTLALAIPNDLVVPASRARLVGEASRVVSPRGINGHAAIVGSADGLSIAYDFLRDGALSCRTPWDLWGPRVERLRGQKANSTVSTESARPWDASSCPARGCGARAGKVGAPSVGDGRNAEGAPKPGGLARCCVLRPSSLSGNLSHRSERGRVPHLRLCVWSKTGKTARLYLRFRHVDEPPPRRCAGARAGV